MKRTLLALLFCATPFWAAPMPIGSFVQAIAPGYEYNRLESDFALTMLGGTGSGFLQFGFNIFQDVDTEDTFLLRARVNSVTVFEYFGGGAPPRRSGVAFEFGQPLFMHLEMTASVYDEPGARHNGGRASLTLTDISYDVAAGPRYSNFLTAVVDVPEPSSATLALPALLLAGWLVGRRRSSHPAKFRCRSRFQS